MEKNKKKIKIKKIIFVSLCLILVVSSFVVSSLATSIYPSNDTEYYLARMPIKDITIRSPKDYGIEGVSGLSVTLTDSFDGRISLLPFDTQTGVNYDYLKYGTYINYPLQYNDYTSAGRLVTLGVAGATSGNLYNKGMTYYGRLPADTKNLVYDFALYEEQTLTVPSSALSRNLLNGNEISVHFNDFLVGEELTAVFSIDYIMYSPFAVPDNVEVVETYNAIYKSTENKMVEVGKYFTYSFEYEEISEGYYHCRIYSPNDFGSPPDSSSEEVIIRDYTLNYKPYGENYSSFTNRRIIDTRITNTVDVVDKSSYYYSSPLIDYFKENPIEHYYVESIADISFTDWLETSIGGFLDFEFIPNVTLGTMLLVTISFGIVFFIIRMWRG